jgi:GTP-binding protein
MVAIVGRPNVGKSSLFNAWIENRTAIVSEVAGTTRDRLSAEVVHLGRTIVLVDTGGLVPEAETTMDELVFWQVKAAVGEADAVIFVTDAVQGVTYHDRHVAQLLRESGRPVGLAVNKVDSSSRESLVPEFYQLGLGEPYPVSALHRRGLDGLLDTVLGVLPPEGEAVEEAVGVPHFAIVGRPNVGKSAIVNAVLGMERSIVSEIPGTTRDALDTTWEFEGKGGVLIDTAGIRRRGAIQPGIERYSVLRAIRAIDRSHVAVVVLDATELVTAQDLHIAGQVRESFRGAVVVVNKWDLVPEAMRDEELMRRRVLSRLRFMDRVPVRFTSALTGEGIESLMSTAFEVYNQGQRWVDPRKLNTVVMDAIAEHLPPKQRTSSMKIYRVRQESVGPPTFYFYCNNPDLLHFSYERYLENVIRRTFNFRGVHLRLEFRGRSKVRVGGGHRGGVTRPKVRSGGKGPAR